MTTQTLIPRILISEDDKTSRLLLTAMLRKWGFDPIATEHGEQAWEVYSQSTVPTLILLDWDMPVLNGIEVCRRIRAQEIEQPPYIILITNMLGKDDIVQGLSTGANDYVVKPYHPQELHARIDVGLRMMELQSALTTKVHELQKALEDVKTLRGILPICASCKKIRDDSGYWTQVEVYIHSHSDAEFSHSLCPQCITALYPEFADEN